MQKIWDMVSLGKHLRLTHYIIYEHCKIWSCKHCGLIKTNKASYCEIIKEKSPEMFSLGFIGTSLDSLEKLT